MSITKPNKLVEAPLITEMMVNEDTDTAFFFWNQVEKKILTKVYTLAEFLWRFCRAPALQESAGECRVAMNDLCLPGNTPMHFLVIYDAAKSLVFHGCISELNLVRANSKHGTFHLLSTLNTALRLAASVAELDAFCSVIALRQDGKQEIDVDADEVTGSHAQFVSVMIGVVRSALLTSASTATAAVMLEMYKLDAQWATKQQQRRAEEMVAKQKRDQEMRRKINRQQQQPKRSRPTTAAPLPPSPVASVTENIADPDVVVLPVEAVGAQNKDTSGGSVSNGAGDSSGSGGDSSGAARKRPKKVVPVVDVTDAVTEATEVAVETLREEKKEDEPQKMSSTNYFAAAQHLPPLQVPLDDIDVDEPFPNIHHPLLDDGDEDLCALGVFSADEVRSSMPAGSLTDETTQAIQALQESGALGVADEGEQVDNAELSILRDVVTAAEEPAPVLTEPAVQFRPPRKKIPMAFYMRKHGHKASEACRLEREKAEAEAASSESESEEEKEEDSKEPEKEPEKELPEDEKEADSDEEVEEVSKKRKRRPKMTEEEKQQKRELREAEKRKREELKEKQREEMKEKRRQELEARRLLREEEERQRAEERAREKQLRQNLAAAAKIRGQKPARPKAKAVTAPTTSSSTSSSSFVSVSAHEPAAAAATQGSTSAATTQTVTGSAAKAAPAVTQSASIAASTAAAGGDSDSSDVELFDRHASSQHKQRMAEAKAIQAKAIQAKAPTAKANQPNATEAKAVQPKPTLTKPIEAKATPMKATEEKANKTKSSRLSEEAKRILERHGVDYISDTSSSDDLVDTESEDEPAPKAPRKQNLSLGSFFLAKDSDDSNAYDDDRESDSAGELERDEDISDGESCEDEIRARPRPRTKKP